MEKLRIAFDTLPMARWGPLFQVLCLELPDLGIEWKPADFPGHQRPLAADADVHLLVGPPPTEGVDSVVLESSRLAVVMAAGHPLARYDELSVEDVLDEPFPGAPRVEADWKSLWTLDDARGGPPTSTDDDVRNAADGLHVVAAGRAIATLPGTLALGLPHPGIVAVPLTDGPQATTSLVWRSDSDDPIVHHLASLARDMTARGGD